MDSASARLTVHRQSPHDEGERLLFVSLDGERLGPLGFGRTLARDIPPGSHRMRIHNTFAWKTLDFEARGGDDLHFGAVNVTPGCMVGLAAALGAAPMFVRIVPWPDEARTAAADETGRRTP
jgi:hypothetical protein